MEVEVRGLSHDVSSVSQRSMSSVKVNHQAVTSSNQKSSMSEMATSFEVLLAGARVPMFRILDPPARPGGWRKIRFRKIRRFHLRSDRFGVLLWVLTGGCHQMSSSEAGARDRAIDLVFFRRSSRNAPKAMRRWRAISWRRIDLHPHRLSLPI